jgi:Amt family ammonium transporter
MQETLCSQLRSWKLDTAVASTGDDAMRMLTDAAAKTQPYDVAIIDSELADISTLELGNAIKARPEIAGTVLLILLPWGADLDPLKLRKAGFSGHLLKPVRQSRLYNSIVDAMGSKSQSKLIAAEAPPISESSASPTVKETPAARILIAEDNRVNQIVATEVLTKHGYTCDIVDNGNKAIAAVLAGRYDLVLMDCSMPGMDGFEATRQIRRAESADPASPPRHIPIIALTANAIKGDRDRCLEAGMDDYVSKPLDPDLLVRSIQALLARSGRAPSPLPVNEGVAAPAKTPLPNQPDDTLPFAIEALLDRCMGNAETVTLILNEFEQQAVRDLEEIKRNLAGSDHEATARVAHALKGASGILSAATLSDIAFQLEQMGRSGVLTDADQLFDQLNNEVQRCIAYLPNARAAMAAKTEICTQPALKGGIP